MKTLKKCFALIVAVATIALTVSAQKGVFKAKKSMDEQDCFFPNIEIKTQQCNLYPELTASTECSGTSLNGAYVFNINPMNYSLSPNVDCPGDFKFCCAFVERDFGPWCVGQPAFDLGSGSFYYRISSIRCTIE